MTFMRIGAKIEVFAFRIAMGSGSIMDDKVYVHKLFVLFVILHITNASSKEESAITSTK